MKMKRRFDNLAHKITLAAGSPYGFLGALAGILVWMGIGVFVGFGNNTFQLAINTITTIITFLMVFLIQSTQNRDSAALHLKIDELIMSSSDARNTLLRAENMTDEEIEALKEEFRKMEDKVEEEELKK